jgi:hypothetical protein
MINSKPNQNNRLPHAVPAMPLLKARAIESNPIEPHNTTSGSRPRVGIFCNERVKETLFE